MAGSQLSLVQSLASSHTGGVPGTHVPSTGLQVSKPLQALSSLQRTSLPRHTPRVQASFVVHSVPSSQGRTLKTCRQPWTASQLSSVQGFRSSQLSGVPAPQTPPAQVSIPSQTLPSSHSAGVDTQRPIAVSQ